MPAARTPAPSTLRSGTAPAPAATRCQHGDRGRRQRHSDQQLQYRDRGRRRRPDGQLQPRRVYPAPAAAAATTRLETTPTPAAAAPQHRDWKHLERAGTSSFNTAAGNLANAFGDSITTPRPEDTRQQHAIPEHRDRDTPTPAATAAATPRLDYGQRRRRRQQQHRDQGRRQRQRHGQLQRRGRQRVAVGDSSNNTAVSPGSATTTRLNSSAFGNGARPPSPIPPPSATAPLPRAQISGCSAPGQHLRCPKRLGHQQGCANGPTQLITSDAGGVPTS